MGSPAGSRGRRHGGPLKAGASALAMHVCLRTEVHVATLRAIRFGCLAIVFCIALGGLLVLPAQADSGAQPPITIRVLSNRADLVSGGDALLEIRFPDGLRPRDIRISAGGRDVTRLFRARSNGSRLLGVVKGLPVGATRVTVRTPNGTGAYLDVTNHSANGPIFAGPQVQPWICRTEESGLGPARDAACSARAVYEFFYKPAGGGDFQPYDPSNPPKDVATTRTDRGLTVPYIVRRERGVIDRGIYDVAVLFDPRKAWSAVAPQPGWNRKVFWRLAGDCNGSHVQPTTVGLLAEAQTSVLHDHALSKGFAVVASGLNILGQNCNDVVSAEGMMMLKEHIAERYGPIRYVMSEGPSGASMQQHWITSNYPGLLDGIMPSDSFSDLWLLIDETQDCLLLDRAAVAAGIVDPADFTAVSGHEDVQTCAASTEPYGAKVWQDPADQSACQGGVTNLPLSLLPAPWVYNRVTNPTGVRCSVQDYQVALFGRRPESVWSETERAAGGFANRPFDNVGLEYGRKALLDGDITAEQFVALNERIGGTDIDGLPQAGRSVADPAALVRAYRGGRVSYLRAAARVPIIDVRVHNPCNADPLRVHSCFHTFGTRARLKQVNGHADNQVMLYQPPANYAFNLLDRWLTSIERDKRDAPLARKVVQDRPRAAVHACWTNGTRTTDWQKCRAMNPTFGNPRLVAGGPLAQNILKCALKPLRRADYPPNVTDTQWVRLQVAFPTGVCDWSKRGIGQQPPRGVWQSYEQGPDGRPLGPAPTSVPFPLRSSVDETSRHFATGGSLVRTTPPGVPDGLLLASLVGCWASSPAGRRTKVRIGTGRSSASRSRRNGVA